MNILRLALLVCSLALGHTALAGDGLVAVPPLTSPVTDLTGTLDASQRATLESGLRAFEKERGSQIAILLLPTTKPETIEQYSIRVAEAWKVGRKGKDDGVIVLVAKDDHKLRIEVGYGLEGGLNDATAKRIVSEIMAPRFKAGDWAGGLQAGVERIQAVIAGENLPPPEAAKAGSDSDWEDAALAPGLVACLFVGTMLCRALGRLLGGLVTGGVAGGIAFVVFSSLIAALTAGVLVFALVLLSGARSSHWGRGAYGGWGRHSSGGWGGGWSGGSGGGSSGWSGGGGGFGGGGASGDW